MDRLANALMAAGIGDLRAHGESVVGALDLPGTGQARFVATVRDDQFQVQTQFMPASDLGEASCQAASTFMGILRSQVTIPGFDCGVAAERVLWIGATGELSRAAQVLPVLTAISRTAYKSLDALAREDQLARLYNAIQTRGNASGPDPQQSENGGEDRPWN